MLTNVVGDLMLSGVGFKILLLLSIATKGSNCDLVRITGISIERKLFSWSGNNTI
jgi:hypothetical protein